MMLSCQVRFKASLHHILQATKAVTGQVPASNVFSRQCSSLSPDVKIEEAEPDPPSAHPRIVTSPIPDIEIRPRNFSEAVWENVFKSPQTQFNTALINAENGRSYSYRECEKLRRNFAANLIKMGARKGDVLALILPNVPEFVFVFTGAPLAGVTVTTIPPSMTSYEMRGQLSNSGATWVITNKERIGTVMQAVEEIDKSWRKDMTLKGTSGEKIHVVLDANQEECPTGVMPLSLMLANDSEVPEVPDFDYNEDVMVIPYSSGTTGPPKGVELTHKNMVSNMEQIACPDMGYFNPPDRDFREVTVCVLPLYHVYAMNVTMSNILKVGGKMVCLPSFNSLSFLNAMITYKPTFLHIAPPVLSFLTTNPGVKAFHLESLRYILVGAAPVAPSLIQRFKEKAPHVEFREGWGMSELSPGGCFSIQGNTIIGSCGQCLPNTEMKVIDPETGELLGPDQPGELLIRGPQVMKGYLNNKEATEKTFMDDWLRSGDMAKYDKDGNIFMVDRMKEIIKCKAMQVSPSELEDILRKHPDIKDSAVYGEVPRAFVEKANRKADEKKTSDSIHAYLHDLVSDHKKLRGGIVFTEKIPRSPAGKILKKNLKLENRKPWLPEEERVRECDEYDDACDVI